MAERKIYTGTAGNGVIEQPTSKIIYSGTITKDAFDEYKSQEGLRRLEQQKPLIEAAQSLGVPLIPKYEPGGALKQSLVTGKLTLTSPMEAFIDKTSGDNYVNYLKTEIQKKVKENEEAQKKKEESEAALKAQYLAVKYLYDLYEPQMSNIAGMNTEQKQALADRVNEELKPHGYNFSNLKQTYESVKKRYDEVKQINYYNSLPNGDYDKAVKDGLYRYINKSTATNEEKFNDYKDTMNYSGTLLPEMRDWDKYRSMTEREIGVYNYIYKNEGKKAANKYLDFINDNLEMRNHAKVLQNLDEFANKNHITAGVAAVASVPLKVGSAVEQIGNSIEYVFTGEMEINKYSDYSSTLRQGMANLVDIEIGDWDVFDFVYNSTMSGVDSFSSSFLGPAGPILLGLDAAASTSNDIIRRGGTASQAFWGGLSAGFFEGFFEKISLGQINALKEVTETTWKQSLGNFVKSVFVNASEEAATETANILYDTFVNKDISNYAAIYDKHYREALSRGLSEEEARKEAKTNARWELVGQVIEAAASGAFMGGEFSAAHHVMSRHNASNIGKIIADNDAQDSIIQIGLSMDISTDSYKIAETIKEKGEISNVSLGKLATQILNDVSSQKNDIVTNSVSRYATTLGISEAEARSVAKYYGKAVAQQGISRKEFNSVKNSTFANNVAKELQTDAAWVNDMKSELSQVEAIEKQVREAITFPENQNSGLQSSANGENVQNSRLQSTAEGDIISQGGEENGRIHNQGTMDGGNETNIDAGRERKIQQSGATVDEYVAGRKAEILSRASSDGRRVVRVNYGKSSVTFTEGKAEETPGYKVYTAFKNAGMKVIYCEGAIERTVNGKVISRTEAFTAPDGTVYVSSESKLPPKQTFDHEKVHVADKTNNPAYAEYEAVLCDEVDYTSTTYKRAAMQINEFQFENKYDIDDISSYPIFMREIAAYISQFVLSDPTYAQNTFGGMFGDWNAVVDAVNKFNTDMKADFTESASFMPENASDSSDNDSGASENASDSSDNDSGELHRDGDIVTFDGIDTKKGRHLNKAQQDEIKDIGKKLGVEVVFEDFYKLERFKGKKKVPDGGLSADGKVHINYYAKRPVQFLLKHEITHYLKRKLGKLDYQDFMGLVIDSQAFTNWMHGKGFSSITELKKDVYDRYSEVENFDEPKCFDEILADFVGDYLFGGENAVSQKLINALGPKQKKTFMETIKDIIAHIKGIFSEKARQNARLQKEISDLEDRFLQLYNEAVAAPMEDYVDNNDAYRISNDSEGSFVKVDAEQKLFNGKSVGEMQIIARNIIKDKFKGKVLSVGEEGKAYINKRSAEEYAYPANRRMDNSLKASKMRAAPELENLLAVSNYIEHQLDDGRHPEATGGWNIYSTRFEVGEEMFTGEVKIMITDRGYVFYDITQIKRTTRNGGQTEINSAAASGSPSINSIADKSNTVKNNISEEGEDYSIPSHINPRTKSDTRYSNRDSEGHKLTDGQQDYFRESKARDEKGRLEAVYHGTKNAGFTKFAKSDDIGYFYTTSLETARTYANHSKTIYAPDKNSPEISGAAIYKGYLNLKKPYVIDCKGANWNGIESTGEQVDLKIKVKNWNDDKTGNAKITFKYGGKTYSQNVHNADEFEGFLAKHLNDSMAHSIALITSFKLENGKGELSLSYAWDFNKKEKAATKTTRDIVRRAYESEWDYDGVKFKNVVDSGDGSKVKPADIYVAFNSNQFKSVNNADPTYDPDIRFSIPATSNHEELLEAYEKGEISRREYLDALKKEKTLNPKEIADLTEEDANTTPKLKKQKGESIGDKESKFYSSVLESDIFDLNFKAEVATDSFVQKYTSVTNKETLLKAAKELDEGGRGYVSKWWNVDPEHASLIDTAVGLILMDRYQRVGDYESGAAVAEKVRAFGTAGGQQIQIFSILGRLTHETMAAYAQRELDKAFELLVNDKSQKWIEKNKDKFKLTDSDIELIRLNTLQAAMFEEGTRAKAIFLGKIAARIQEKIPPQKGDSLRAFQRNAMLLNLKTNIRNVTGNAGMVGVFIASDVFGSGIDKLIAKKTGVRTTGNFNFKSVKGFKKGLYESYDDFKRGIKTKQDELNRFDVNIGHGKSFNDNSDGLFGRGILKNQLNAVAKALNKIDNFTSFCLEAGDRPFFEMHFMNSLNNQMKLNNVDAPTEAMVEIARQEALQRTWQDDNEFTRSVSRLKRVLNTLVHLPNSNYGLGDFVLKFVKTPANLAKAIIEFSPAGFYGAAKNAKKMKNAIETNRFNAQMQKEFVRSLSNAITGTLLYTLIAVGASLGLVKLTGDDDEDKDVSNFEKYIMGVPPYSIEFFGISITYDWMQPFGSILATVAEYMEASTENPDMDTADVVWEAICAGGKTFTQQSFLQSMYELFSGDDFIDGLADAALAEPAAFVPQIFSQTASFLDEYRRTTYDANSNFQTAINKVMAKIPGLRTLLPKQVNSLGENVKNSQYYENVFGVWEAFASPWNTYPKSSKEVVGEIYKLYKDSGEASVMPRMAPNYFERKGKRVNFTAAEKADFQRAMGDRSVQMLAQLFDSKEYESLTDKQKVKIVSDIYSYSFARAKSELEYDFETLSAFMGENNNGEPILTKEKYDRMSDESKKKVAEELFLTKTEIKYLDDYKKLVEYYIRKAKD